MPKFEFEVREDHEACQLVLICKVVAGESRAEFPMRLDVAEANALASQLSNSLHALEAQRRRECPVGDQ